MARGDKCRVSNCKNILSKNGTVCGTHIWRMKNYGQYDRLDYKREPNKYIPIPDLPQGMVFKCKIHGLLPLEDTYPKKYKDNIHYKCKKCILSLNIKKKYSGLNSIEDYENMAQQQNGKCAICEGFNTTKRNGKIKRFAIDHCHKTQKVRGLLCAFCNALIGYARDDINILEKAILYLKSHQ